MKYWFFDGNDVIGPYTPGDLVSNKSFSATSLICPEEFSDDGDHWQPAALFAELKALLAQKAREAQDADTSLEDEMDTLLKERSPLSFDQTPTDSGSGLEIPKKPSKPGPIEDYFNNIKEEDLGNILGIPDPNDDSDMDLAHALEKQLSKTSSTRREQLQNTLTEQPAPNTLEQTHHVATATEVFGPQTPADEQALTMPTLPPSTMPMIANEQPAAQPAPQPEQAQPQPTAQGQSASQIPATSQEIAATDFAHPAQPDQPTEPTQPVADKPQEPTEEVQQISDPALLRAEKIEVNSVRARLKQTKQMKDFLTETQNTHLKKQYKAQRKIMVALLAALAILIALIVTLQFKKPSTPLPVSTPAQEARKQELLTPAAPVATPPPAVVAAQPLSQEQKALAIVQNYQLSGQRGTLANYLNRIYKNQLAHGYSASWQAEPLYKNAYIVKYRLTKSRKEPIIYVFQADVAANKLTGALNNISLDLVGKI